jgi:hypothetical protein
MEKQVYLEIESRDPSNALSIELDDNTDDVYELTDFRALSEIVLPKHPSAKYVLIEQLWEPELNCKVFNLMFYDDDEESIGGMELSPVKVYWDDE